MSDLGKQFGKQVSASTAFVSWLGIVIAFTILACTVSLWFWIGTALFVGFGIAFVVWLRRRNVK